MWDYQTLGAILVGIVRALYLKGPIARSTQHCACGRSIATDVLVTKIRNASPIGGDLKSKYSAVACDRVSQALLGLSGSSESEMAVILLDGHECMP
jgi:hypothetical protein